MEAGLKVSGQSEPLKKAIGVAKRQSERQKISNFLHARYRATNTKLGLHSSNMINSSNVYQIKQFFN